MYKTSRQRILEYLEQREAVSAGELAQAFRMTAANARHHLASLVEEGAVRILVAKSQGGQAIPVRRGRPEQLYQLSKNLEADNLGKLASALLSFAMAVSNPDSLYTHLADQLSGGTAEGRHMTVRLQQAIRRLNAMNYRARWEARADAPRLVLGHCPYAGILSDHPELCAFDERLLAAMLGAEVHLAARLEEVRPGVRQCVFRVRLNPGTPQP